MRAITEITLLSYFTFGLSTSYALTANDGIRTKLLFVSVQEAALAAANSYNPQSIRENREYMGTVFEQDGKFGYTVFAAQSSADSWRFSVPGSEWEQVRAVWHTHGAEAAGNQYFSAADTSSVNRLKVPFYLADHTGFLKVFRAGDRTLSPRAASRLNLPRRAGFATGDFVRDESSRRVRVSVRRARSVASIFER